MGEGRQEPSRRVSDALRGEMNESCEAHRAKKPTDAVSRLTRSFVG